MELNKIQDPKELFDLLVESAESFDFDAAESATPEDAMKCLKVLKHYIKVVFGNKNVNLYLKLYLNYCGLEAEVPGSVVGGYKFALDLLKLSHKCSGKDCVLKYRQRKSSRKEFASRIKRACTRNKISVKRQKKVPDENVEKGTSNQIETPSYII
ncbi:uncharacterized protein TNIN_243961 [Trichonephila inaurata madagascariensis]|uniref:Uncharacterized protein n=1 Tax=Trichonephila inaurata madagascariensis TaxID=2747483 RepID=A0A8X6XRM4_9ARAC|nr:uncharacterized protein TNIN_243961 [Trichonephila inaurata madagascariensis]